MQQIRAVNHQGQVEMMEEHDTTYVSIVAPAFNEAAIIETVVREWMSVLSGETEEWEIVVTDDGSTDGTGTILRRLTEEDDHIKVVSLSTNKGCGYALRQAIDEARGKYVVTIDADGQFDLADYKSLFGKLTEGYDIVTGFRRHKIDTVTRVVSDRIYHLIVKMLFGVHLRDTNCALKVYKSSILKAIQIDSRGYSIPTELLIKARALGYRIGEVGVTHSGRTVGVSKLKVVTVGWQTFIFLVYLKLKLLLHKRGVVNSL
jgi:glycosyltransferase involved in cell wall biosynthesis